MKTLLVVGFFVVCVIAHDSNEKPDSKEKPGEKPVVPPAAAGGGHGMECKKNETSGCKPCGPEKACHAAAPPASETPCTTDCKPACVCLEGYVKGPEGHCILLADCPKS